MMANNWKTKKEIMADYGYSEGTFYSRCKECSLLPDYRDAIIHAGGQRTYVDENRFQDFCDIGLNNTGKECLILI